jgi:hypothetical protein
MIQFQILSVIKRSSPTLPTTRYTYNDKGETDPKVTIGAEWEEIEFTTLQEDKPVIQISNIVGSVFLVGNTGRIILNNPGLFGTYKAGDIINFSPVPPENHQLARRVTEVPVKDPEDNSQ